MNIYAIRQKSTKLFLKDNARYPRWVANKFRTFTTYGIAHSLCLHWVGRHSYLGWTPNTDGLEIVEFTLVEQQVHHA